uniref:Uncharacterized protein n=1 Tax=Alexandrium andersonii TaxID=327968 RepID=A0A7S2NIR5_9DINO
MAASRGSARIWDALDGKPLWSSVGHAEGEAVNSAFFSTDGAIVLTASDDGTAKLWSVSSGQCVRTFEGHAGAVHSAVFSADDSWVLTTSGDGTARLWCATSGRCTQTFQSSCAAGVKRGLPKLAAFPP